MTVVPWGGSIALQGRDVPVSLRPVMAQGASLRSNWTGARGGPGRSAGPRLGIFGNVVEMLVDDGRMSASSILSSIGAWKK
jgi:hypothetical protein